MCLTTHVLSTMYRLSGMMIGERPGILSCPDIWVVTFLVHQPYLPSVHAWRVVCAVPVRANMLPYGMKCWREKEKEGWGGVLSGKSNYTRRCLASVTFSWTEMYFSYTLWDLTYQFMKVLIQCRPQTNSISVFKSLH